jgi:hypothetical protein
LTRTRNFKIQQNFFQKSLGEKLDGGFWKLIALSLVTRWQ